MLIAKNYINCARNVLKDIIRNNNEYLKTLTARYQKCLIKPLSLEEMFLKEEAITRFNEIAGTDFGLFSGNAISEWYNNQVAKVLADNERAQSIIDGLSVKGMTKACYNFPRLILSFNENSYDYQYFILTGIKRNGMERNPLEESMSESEKLLVYFEQRLSSLINDDYMVDIEDKEAFLDLYYAYLQTFSTYIKSLLLHGGKVPLDYKIALSAHCMEQYILGELMPKVKTTNDIPKENIIGAEAETKGDSLINEYISQGRVVKICSLEEFQALLSDSTLPINLQREYLLQMKNLINRTKLEQYENKKAELRRNILDDEAIILYEEAKTSNQIKATELVKDIDALFDLLLEATDEEEKESLISECYSFIGSLRAILVKSEEQSLHQVLYFKDNNAIPYFEQSLYDNKEDYNQIFVDFNKILDGKLNGDRVLKGDTPIKVFAKGKKFRIFYCLIAGIPIIICGGSGKNIFAKVTKLVNTEEFKNYIEELKALINSSKKPNEHKYTEVILKKLKSTSLARVRSTDVKE